MKNIIGKLLIATSLLTTSIGTAAEVKYPMQGFGSLLFCGGFATNVSVKTLGVKSELKEVYAWARDTKHSTRTWKVDDIVAYLKYKGFTKTTRIDPRAKWRKGDIILLPNIPFVIDHWVTVIDVIDDGTVIMYDSMGDNNKPLHRVKDNIRRVAVVRPMR